MVTHTSDAAFAEQVKAVFQRYHAFADVELQQRSIEYFSLAQLHVATLKDVLVRWPRARAPAACCLRPERALLPAVSQAEMPRFPERASALERRIDPDAAESHSSVRPRTELAAQQTEAALPEPVPAPAHFAHSEGGLIDVEPAAVEVAQSAAATRPTGFDALDLLNELAVQAAPPPDNTLAGLEDFSSGRPVASVVPVVPTQDTQQLFRKLCAADSGACGRQVLLPPYGRAMLTCAPCGPLPLRLAV
jgi:hypothetical protein